MTSLRATALSGAMTMVGRGLAVRLLGLVSTLVMARLLGTSEFGLLAAGMALQALGLALIDAGLGADLIRRREEPSARDYSTVAVGQAVAAMTVTLTVAAVAVLQDSKIAALSAIFLVGLSIATFRAPSFIRLE